MEPRICKRWASNVVTCHPHILPMATQPGEAVTYRRRLLASWSRSSPKRAGRIVRRDQASSQHVRSTDQVIRDLADSESLSQFGNHFKPEGGPAFRRAPRWGKEQAISVIAGRIGVKRAAVLVRGNVHPGDGVRHTVVGRLRGEGFAVRHTPSPMNPDHVSVSYPGDWTEKVSQAFDDCFEVPKWEESP
jgi:hypothetical protein